MKLLIRLGSPACFYLSSVCLLVGALIGLVLSSDHIDGFELLNQYHSPELDALFTFITFLGDGLFTVIIFFALIIFTRYRKIAIQILLAFLLSGLLTHLFKNTFLLPRPFELLKNTSYQFFIEGVTNKGWKSFPSGHTTSIFSLTTIIAFNVRSRIVQLFLTVIAAITAYSRIYLGCHFPEDILAGASIGTIVSIIVANQKYLNTFSYRQLFSKKIVGINSVEPITNLDTP